MNLWTLKMFSLCCILHRRCCMDTGIGIGQRFEHELGWLMCLTGKITDDRQNDKRMETTKKKILQKNLKYFKPSCLSARTRCTMHMHTMEHGNNMRNYTAYFVVRCIVFCWSINSSNEWMKRGIESHCMCANT